MTRILNNPFYYEPHPECRDAARLVIADIENHPEWHEEMLRGKMFGVLIYDGGFLKAYSGQILGRSDWAGYVPPIHDYLQPDGYFKTEEANIVAINKEIDTLDNLRRSDPKAWTKQQETMTRQKKEERRRRSIALQQWLFRQFEVSNSLGETKNLLDVFAEWAERVGSKCTVPPSGSGECCAPKLLQYAYNHGIRPLAIAEFWYQSTSLPSGGGPGGGSPYDGKPGCGRISGKFYGACMSRCKPILEWMLKGIDYDPYALDSQDETTSLPVLYEDERIIAVDKPSGMLSVPGKSSRRSAYDILRTMRPECENLMMVHRLDMQTSGILVAAKTLEVYKEIQRLILADDTHHEDGAWAKEYIAVLEGVHPLPVGSRGEVNLPLSADFLNRPMQKVDYENGKPSMTHYEIIGVCDGHTVVRLHPLTGRTHQLRIHCAHPEGLGMPILGDDLYGTHDEILYLHARKLKVGDVHIEAPLHWKWQIIC